MLLGVLIGKKSYPMKKYFFTLLIVIGVSIFMYRDDKLNTQESTAFGQILILFSLFMNGVTGVAQDRITRSYKPNGQQMMMKLNQISSIILCCLIFVTGEWKEFLTFTSAHHEIIKDLILLAVTNSLGQFFIFIMISDFGSLPCSIVTTVRKFFAVLFSVMLFGNSLSRLQWCGTILVFGGLFADSAIKNKISMQK
jgi:UDP-galactose transporter B1